MKSFFPNLIITIAGIICLIIFSYLDLGPMFLVIFGLISIILLIKNSKLIIYFFLILLPANDIFPNEVFLFSFLGLKQIMTASIIAFYIKNRHRINNGLKYILRIQVNKKVYDFLNAILVILTIYFSYTYFKNAFFGLHEFDFKSASLKSLNMSLYLIACILAFKAGISMLRTSEANQILYISLMFMIIFSFLTPFLQPLGFRFFEREGIDQLAGGIERYFGVIADGDSNTLSIYIVMAMSMCLLFFGYYKKIVFLYLLFPLSILFSIAGSRTGFTALVCVFVLFFLFVNNKYSTTSKLYVGLFLPLIAIVSFPYLEILLSRFLDIGEQFDLETDSNRIGKWILYINFFFDNKITFFSGAQKELLISWDGKYYAAHNVFITMIYNSGVILVILFLFQFIKVIVYLINKKEFEYLLVIFPAFILINTVSDLGIIYSLLLFIFILMKNKTFLFFLEIFKRHYSMNSIKQ
jgi:hypothetical protein